MTLQFFSLLPKLRHAVLASDSAMQNDDSCGARTERFEAVMMAAAQGSAECLPWVMMTLERNDTSVSQRYRTGGAHAEFT